MTLKSNTDYSSCTICTVYIDEKDLELSRYCAENMSLFPFTSRTVPGG